MRANPGPLTLMLLTLVLGLAAIPVTAQEIDVSGSWTLTMTTPRGESMTALVFVQEGDQLTVNATGDRGESTGSGTITGNAIAWTIVRPTPMGEMSFTYQGTVTGDTMSGEVKMMNNTVPWQALRDGSSEQAGAVEAKASEGLAALENLVIVEDVQPVPERLKVGFDSILGDELHTNLAFIASDALQGRDTGTLGHQVAAEYAATMFSLWGLQPAGDLPPQPSARRMMMGPEPPMDPPGRGYLQQIELKETVETGGSARAEWRRGALYMARSFARDVDYQYGARASEVITAPVVFVGYGLSETEIGFDEYAGVDTRGKIVLMLDGVPRPDDPDSKLGQEIKDKYAEPANRRMSRFRQTEKDKIAQDHGAVAIIMVESEPEEDGDVARRVLQEQEVDDDEPIVPGERRLISLIESSDQRMGPFKSLPTIRASRQMAGEILRLAGQELDALQQAIEDDLIPRSAELSGLSFTVESTVQEQLLRSPNVLGYVEGSDPELKDEVVVIGAHLDHLGARGGYTFNGADDNGSGSVAVLELAQAFAVNPVKPKRSVLFALWTGEEKGLLGSRYYVSHPFFPLAKTVVNLNLDMVSREWDKERLKRMSRMFGVSISDAELEAIDISKLMSISFADEKVRQAAVDNNQYVGMMVFLREAENGGMGAGGSDHAPFARKEIPWAFLAAGVTEDFHEPSDSVEKTSRQLMEGIARLTYLTAFALADQE